MDKIACPLFGWKIKDLSLSVWIIRKDRICYNCLKDEKQLSDAILKIKIQSPENKILRILTSSVI